MDNGSPISPGLLCRARGYGQSTAFGGLNDNVNGEYDGYSPMPSRRDTRSPVAHTAVNAPRSRSLGSFIGGYKPPETLAH